MKRYKENHDRFYLLPYEIWNHVFSFLSWKAHIQFTLLSHTWHRFICSSLWRIELKSYRLLNKAITCYPNIVDLSLNLSCFKKLYHCTSYFTKLNRLSIIGATCLTQNRKYLELSCLSLLTTLKYLDIQYCKLNYHIYISCLLNLQSIHIIGSNVLDKSLSYFSVLTKLQKIKLQFCDGIENKELSYLSELTNLQHIDISGNFNISNIGIAHLSNLTNLSYINIRYCYMITEQGMLSLTRLTNLQTIIKL